MATERCRSCGKKLILEHAEDGSMNCSSCGYEYTECGRCGETVGETEWREDVGMCDACWDATVSPD